MPSARPSASLAATHRKNVKASGLLSETYSCGRVVTTAREDLLNRPAGREAGNSIVRPLALPNPTGASLS